jgi:DNA (cytosine-5)-methyltransferase 1
VAKEIEPTFIFLENTKGILANGGVTVIEELAAIGFSSRWITKSCKEVGSPQNRERWFCLSYSESKRLEKKRLSLRTPQKQSRSNSLFKYQTWYEGKKSPSPFYRMDDDISFRMDRTKALGNAVVPEQAKEAFKELIGLKSS